MKKSIFIGFLAAVSLLIGVNFAQAEITLTGLTAQTGDLPTANANGQQVGQACSIFGDKVDIKIGNYDLRKTKHQTVYDNLKSRLINLSEKLTAKGYDTSDLKADLVVLDQKIKKFVTDYQAYVDKLKATKQYTCGESKGQYRTAFKDAKTALVAVRKDASDIRSYFVNTIKPDLIAIRAQKVNANGDNASSTDANND